MLRASGQQWLIGGIRYAPSLLVNIRVMLVGSFEKDISMNLASSASELGEWVRNEIRGDRKLRLNRALSTKSGKLSGSERARGSHAIRFQNPSHWILPSSVRFCVNLQERS